jgi:hypothetical protein
MRPKMDAEGGRKLPQSHRPRLPPMPQEATTRAKSDRGSGRICVSTAAERLSAMSSSQDVHRPAELCAREVLLKTPWRVGAVLAPAASVMA